MYLSGMGGDDTVIFAHDLPCISLFFKTRHPAYPPPPTFLFLFVDTLSRETRYGQAGPFRLCVPPESGHTGSRCRIQKVDPSTE
jgi:hypothetical protein